jgi:CO/xanthine dehydrogenase FAD-binding subunit
VEFVTAESVEHGLDWLSNRGEHTLPVAGGTDVMIQLARKECSAATLLSLSKLEPPFSSIEFDPSGNCRIGASVTHRTIATDARIKERFPALAAAAATVGGYQTQAVGTIGGNICNASPAADLLPPLLVYDAKIELIRAGVSEPRSLKLSEFLVGRRATRRESTELVSTIVIPTDGITHDVYLKVGRRSATEVAIVGLAVRVGCADSGGEITNIAVCCSRSDLVESLQR